MNNYLLSIILPTKDRYFYLEKLIQLIKGFNSDEIEVIVQDNTADNGEILSFLEENNYPHLKYYHEKDQLPISYNSDLAILHSTGEYVCFIGDDDGVSRHILECVKWMKRENIEILKTALTNYKWPGFSNNDTIGINETLTLSEKCNGKYYTFNCLDYLEKGLKKASVNLRYMPKVYNGIVKRSTLDKVYKEAGTFFPGPSPDMANAVALCFVSDTYTYLDFPILIGGRCHDSGGNEAKLKGGGADIDKVPFLPKDAKEKWEKFIPKIWCSSTVLAESMVKALRGMGREDYLKYYDIDRMLAGFMLSNRPIKSMGYELASNKLKVMGLFGYNYFVSRFSAVYSLIKSKLFRKSDLDRAIISDVHDIIEAEEVVARYYPKFVNPTHEAR